MTDEEVEKWLDEAYDELDRHEFEMEEIGLIMHGDRSYYIQYPDEYEKDKKICELENEVMRLERRLSNCIEPKFKTYQQVYTISKFYTSTNGIPEYEIFNSYYYVAENENEIIVGWNYKKDFNKRKYYYVRKDWVFATEEEAKAKLEEMKNE